MDGLSWISILQLGVTTSIATAILNLCTNWFIERWRDKRRKYIESTYLALRIAVILEKFVGSCIYRVWHDDVDIEEGRDLSDEMPGIVAYPPEAPEWKSFYERTPKLAGQLLSFPNEIIAAEMSCQFQLTRESNHFALAEETIVAGIRAWKLAQSIRKIYDLDVVYINHIDQLESKNAKIQGRTEFGRT